jgi:Mitochondrial branched-chain alpha-ketoacid dehydrogenase kinase
MFEQNYLLGALSSACDSFYLTVIRLAHRLRDMQTLPYIVVMNHSLSHVYDLYYHAFEKFRKVSPIRSIDDNDRFCDVIRGTLKEHLSVIPKLVTGVIEVQDYISPATMDKFVTSMLRSVRHVCLDCGYTELTIQSGSPDG